MAGRAGTVCAMFHCSNSSIQKNSRTFHRFPKDVKVCTTWVHKCERTDLDVVFKKRGSLYLNHVYRVCSDHFTLQDYNNPNQKSQGLKKGTVPNVNLTVTNHAPRGRPRKLMRSLSPTPEPPVENIDEVQAKSMEYSDNPPDAIIPKRKKLDYVTISKKLAKRLLNSNERHHKQRILIAKLKEENKILKSESSKNELIEQLGNAEADRNANELILGQIKQRKKRRCTGSPENGESDYPSSPSLVPTHGTRVVTTGAQREYSAQCNSTSEEEDSDEQMEPVSVIDKLEIVLKIVEESSADGNDSQGNSQFEDVQQLQERYILPDQLSDCSEDVCKEDDSIPTSKTKETKLPSKIKAHPPSKEKVDRKKKLKSWDREAMMSAVEAVKKEELSIQKASRKYNVPETTLRVYVNKQDVLVEKVVDAKLGLGRNFVLSPEIELELAKDCMQMRKQFPDLLTPLLLKTMTCQLATKHNLSRPFAMKWMYNFLKRHQVLDLRKREATTTTAKIPLPV